MGESAGVKFWKVTPAFFLTTTDLRFSFVKLHDTDSEHTSGPYFNHTAVEIFVTATFPAAIRLSLKKKISNCARAMGKLTWESDKVTTLSPQKI